MAIIIIILAVVGFIIYRKFFKTVVHGNMVCVTGGVKSGKTTFSFWLAYRTYKRNLRAVKLRNFVRRCLNALRKKPLPLEELPLFYTVIPVSVPHVLITDELMLRLNRFAYKSVIWIDEASLFADSQNYKNAFINKQLNMLNKLIAHETKGGTIIYNTQSISDLHYSIRRCLSEIYYVHTTTKWLPFMLVASVREERYSEDGMSTNEYNEDLTDTLKRVIMPKSVWKKFDCYCYSALTDNYDCYIIQNQTKTLKAKKIITLDPNARSEYICEEKTSKK